LKLKADDIDGTLKRIKTYWQNNVEPGYPFDSYFIDKKFAESFVKYQKQQTLFTNLECNGFDGCIIRIILCHH
jgi:putative ABC transport system permease protein